MAARDPTRDRCEVELKLAIGSPSAARAAEGELVGATARTLETTYFDTPSRDLHAAGYSLRLRRDGGAWRQSLKGLSGFARYEAEWPAAGCAPELGPLAATPAASLPTALGPVFATRVERRSATRAIGGARIEFSFDEGELLAGGRSWPIHELELELKAGGREALFDEGRRLAAADAFKPAFVSKAERGFALLEGALGRPARFAARALDPGLAPGEAFRLIGRRCLAQLSVNAELVGGADSREAVHQARVAARRLRVAIRVFHDFVERSERTAVATDLAWLAGEFSAVRNLDVLLAGLGEAPDWQVAGRNGLRALRRHLLTARSAAGERAAAAVATARYRLLLLGAARLAETPRAGDETDLQRFASGALERRSRRLRRRLERLDWRDADARHRARIAAKALRYACDFFVGLGPAERARNETVFAAALSDLQDRLGRLNDSVVAEQTIPTILAEARAARSAALAAGWMLGAEAVLRRRRLKSARRAAERFLQAPTWW